MARVAVTEFLDNWLGLSVAVSQSTCVLMQLLHSEPVVSRELDPAVCAILNESAGCLQHRRSRYG